MPASRWRVRDALSRFDARLASLRPRSPAYWLVCAIPTIVLVAAFGASHWIEYARLLHAGVPAAGIVVSVHCGRHASFDYRFEAGGAGVAARGRPGVLGAKCAPALVGRAIDVTYLAGNPAISEPTADVRSLLLHELRLVAALGVAGFAGEAMVLRIGRPLALRARNAEKTS